MSASLSSSSAAPAATRRINYAFPAFSSQDYSSNLLVFPGSNAHEPWGLHGQFTLGGRIYENGAEAVRILPQSCDETGFIQLDFEGPFAAAGRDVRGVGVLELDTTGDIPLEIYISHVHRQSGIYFAYPALMYMGDLLYPHAHVEQLENTLFWPGFHSWETTEFHLAVLNPTDTPMAVEVTLWNSRRGHHSHPVEKVRARHWKWFKIDDILPRGYAEDAHNACSLSVTAQYKFISYMVMINRKGGMITSADHLHPYMLH